MHNLEVGDDPLQLRVSVTRVDMIHDRAIPLAYRFAAPSAWQLSGFPVLVHESDKFLPPPRLVERFTGHQEICPTRKFGGAENLLIV